MRALRLIDRIERRAGLAAAASVVGLAGLLIAAIYVTPTLHPMNLGRDYAAMAAAPRPTPPCRLVELRLLAPWIGWATGLRGDRFIFLPWLAAAALVGATFAFCRRAGWSVADAVGLAALIALTSPVLTALVTAGYPDPLTYLLIGAALAAAWRGAIWWAPLVGLAALSHESALLLAPAALALRWTRGTAPSRVASAAWLIVCIAAVFAVRREVSTACAAGQVYAAGSYLRLATVHYVLVSTLRLFPLGMFEAFKLAWILPLAGVVVARRGGQRAAAGWIALVLAGAAAQCVIATDTSRLLALAFPAVIAGAMALRRASPPALFTRGLWLLVGLNLLVPQYFVGEVLWPMYPTPVVWLIRALGSHAL